MNALIYKNMSDKLDIERHTKAFLKQSFNFLPKFGTFPLHWRIFLFKTYCLSNFGADSWWDLKGCSQAMKTLKITFHKRVKNMLGRFWSSNHEAWISAGMLTFDHLRNSKNFNFAFTIRNSRSASLSSIKGC